MADWFNNDLSDYIDKKEKIIVDTRKNDKICVWSSVISGLFIALFITLFITIFSIVISGFISVTGKPDFTIILVLAPFVFICGYPLLVWLIYNSQRSTRYVLTNHGIYGIHGLIFKQVKFVAYNQITDVSMYKGPIQNLFGAGNVGVGTASGNIVGSVSDGNGSIYSTDELSINSVNDYKKIREIIVKNKKK